jgi:hypothetical protein
MSDRFPAGPGGMGDNMDVDETLVKERFDTALGGVSADVVSLVGGGVAAGRGMRRRRRLQGAVGVVAASALVVGALTLSGAVGNLFNSQGPADRSRTVVELVPATPRGLAAAVMSHASELGSLIGVGGAPAGRSGALMVEVGYQTSTGSKVDLQVVASPQTRLWAREATCRTQRKGTCRRTTLADGTSRIVLQSNADGSAPTAAGTFSGAHVIGVGVLRKDQFVIVLETVVNSASSPLSVAQLQAIATDPVVGVSTTAALNARGKAIPGFKNQLPPLGTSSSSTSSGGGSAGTVTVAPPVQPTRRSGSSPPSSGGNESAPSPASESASTAPPTAP